jgi:hypothetical protein
MRLKISFDDCKSLFSYMDKNNNGVLGYDEFTMLLEERWKGIDPTELRKNSVRKVRNPMETSEKPLLDIYEDCPTDQEQFLRREALSKSLMATNRVLITPMRTRAVEVTDNRRKKVPPQDNKM